MWRNLIKSYNFKCITTQKFYFSALPATEEAKCPFSKDNEKVKYEDAKPFKNIPGPKSIPFCGIAHKFIPGGMYIHIYNI